MILLTVLFGSVLLGQLEPPVEGLHYRVFPKEGDPFYATCLKVDKDVWQFQYNEPTDGTTRKVFPRERIKDFVVEQPDAVQRRFDRYFQERGFVKVPTASGWVQKHEYEFAQQAREMAASLLEEHEHGEADDARAARFLAENGGSDGASPGFLTLWGPQISLALGGLVLIGIIVKLVILGGEPAPGN